jgi:hypothetical protein
MSIKKNADAAINAAFFVPFRGVSIAVAGPTFRPCFLQAKKLFHGLKLNQLNPQNKMKLFAEYKNKHDGWEYVGHYEPSFYNV